MRFQGLAHLLVVYVVWGSTYLAIRIAVRDGSGFPAFAMAGTRVLVAGLILLAWGAIAGKSLKPTRRDLLLFISSGALLWLGGNGLVTWAEKRAESAYAALVVGSLPISITLVESVIDRRAPTLRLVGALLLGISGVAVLSTPVLRGGSPGDIASVGALLVAELSWGVGSIIQKRNPISLDVEASSGYQLVVGAALLLIAAALSGEPRPTPTTEAWLAWGYLVVFGSVIAFTSFLKALHLLPVHVVATYAYVNPVIAVVLGWLILREPITRWTVAGSLLIILGVAGVFHEQRVTAARRQRAAAAAE